MERHTIGGREVIMANKSLFGSSRGRTVKATDAVNAAGGKAYALGPEQALARYAATGCFSNTYYVKAEDHLNQVLDLAGECDSEFIAKLAIFARKEGHMKDMPAFLVATLAERSGRWSQEAQGLRRKAKASEGSNVEQLTKDAIQLEDKAYKASAALKASFPIVIDNGKMLFNFVQIMRSGKLGRKSLGAGPRDLIRGFFARNQPNWLFRQLSVGTDPSVADIIKMVHPKATTPEHDALFRYLIGKAETDKRKKGWKDLPPLVKEFEEWKRDRSLPAPAVDFQLLTAAPLTGAQWAQIFRKGQWHFIRQNLNTAIRRGALKADPGLEEFIAERLQDENIIRKARVMPHQLLSTYKHIKSDVPRSIVGALHDAMELAVVNAPVAEGRTLVVVDVSGSMGGSITGWRSGVPASKIKCIDVAALLSAAIVRKNRDSAVLPVDTHVHSSFRPEPRNPILTEASRLARFGGGGTALSAAFAYANQRRIKVDHVVVISDQESWADRGYYGSGTALMQEWEKLRSRNRNAKLVCLDIVPGNTHQIDGSHKEILQVSGWNDSVFKVISAFLKGDADSWVDMIESIDLAVN